MARTRFAFGNLIKQNLVDMHRGRFLKTKDLFMLLRGEVEYNADPLMLGRLKVRVPQIHGIKGEKNSVKTEDLLWANMLYPRSMKDSGNFIVPQVGEKVWVLFEAGNTDNIVVLGSWFAIPDEAKEYLNPPVELELEKQDMIGRGKKEEREHWSVSCGTELIRECWDIRNLFPAKAVVHKSLKGAMFLIDDRDEEEAVHIIDRLGQALIFESGVSEEDNLGNASRRYDIERGKQITKIMERIRMISGSNKVQLENKVGEVGVLLETDKFKVVLDETAGYIRIRVKNLLNEVILRDDGGLEIIGDIVVKGNIVVSGDIKVNGETELMDLTARNLNVIGEVNGNK